MARTKKPATATADAPAPSLDEQIKKLLERGKKRGSLTYEEINAVFDNVDDVAPERMDDLLEEIASLGIEIVEEQSKDDKPADREEPEEEVIPAGLALDDPVRMYLKEIGRVPLLSMDDERRLAMAIEAGEKEALKNGTADNRVVLDGEESKRKLTEANLRLVVSIAKKYVGRGMLVLHLRDVVDPPGDHARAGRPGADDPHPGAHGRDDQPADQDQPAAAPGAGPRSDGRRDRQRDGAHAGEGARGHQDLAGADLARDADRRRGRLAP